MKQFPRPRVTSELSAAMNRNLTLYALVASSAGVGLLALAPAAEAKIIYTPVHFVLNHGSLPLDLNNDGIVDFALRDKYRRNGQTTNSFWLYVNPEQKSNAAAGSKGTYFRSASAFNRGSLIGPKDRFNGNLMAFACSFASTTDCRVGKWFDVHDRYLGLRFMINGEIHYGWARLNVSFEVNQVPHGTLKATLTGYAYETVPNKAIVAGKIQGPDVVTLQPGRLGHLAQGASAIPAWRAYQTEVDAH
jgi:hypothetical protein